MYEFDSIPGRTAWENGKEYFFFSGYAYLGIQHVPEFVSLVKEGMNRYGWLFPSSRISNTKLKVFRECEALLSSITGTEDTVLVSSGFLAGRLAISRWKDQVVNLIPSHPAIDANATQNPGSNIFAVDAVDTLHATITDFSLVLLSNGPKTIIIDDSHGFGLIGEKGEGITSVLPQHDLTRYVLTYSLSKAPNINAGAVSCSKEIAGHLRTLPEYTACTPPSPALLHAFINGQSLYQRQRILLQNNITYFQSLVNDVTGIKFHSLLPVFVLPSGIDLQKLLEKNIIISSFAYPDPAGEKINRVVLSALHTKSDLEYLAEVLRALITD